MKIKKNCTHLKRILALPTWGQKCIVSELQPKDKLEFKEATDHETRQANANKNQLKIKTARLNPLYSSFTQSHSVLWNLYSDEDLKSCDNYCVAAEKRIDRDLPFLKSSYDAILNGKFVDQTQRRRAHIRRNLGRRQGLVPSITS